MKALASIGCAVFAVCASSAMAADLSVKAPAYRPPMVYAPNPNWTGFYVGANGGWAWQHAASTYAATSNAFSTGLFAPGISDGAIPDSSSQNGDGFLGGITLGSNLQTGRFVYGIEADWMWADIKTTSTTVTNVAALSYPMITTSTTTTTDWLATLRARAGMLIMPEALLYATGCLSV